MKGEDPQNTAMSKLVGLPLGIFVKLVMMGQIKSVGAHIPVIREIYDPVLEELKDYGLRFTERDIEL
jgi:saccharopine dehydrogenase (NADP+, L-glutamate forming)